MKAWGKIRSKRFFSSKPTSEAVTPVVGSILMLLILFVLAGVATVNFFNSAEDGATPQSPMVRISLESCEGGLFNDGPEDERAALKNNTIVLVHEGGSSLPLDAVSIKVSGSGNSYKGIANGNGTKIIGDTEVFYRDLSPKGKNEKYEARNKATVEDRFWGVGEKLILCGNDSSTSIHSSVKVSVKGESDTSDNYGFKTGSEITLKIIDIKSRNILAERTAVVKHAEG
ncbi:MAG: type IV pilin N-terminal domain-containing protein [Methanosarcina sp.]